MSLTGRMSTETLIAAARDTGHTRIGMAVLYATAIKDALSGTDWTRVNKAIIARWSKSGFLFIKRRAWAIVEGRECFGASGAGEEAKTGEQK